jgi:hypothetical protein
LQRDRRGSDASGFVNGNDQRGKHEVSGVKLLLALAAALLLAGCQAPRPAEPPHPNGDEPAPSEKPRLDRTATCSGARVEATLTEQPQLPEPVALTRRDIFEAAVACDLDRLGALAGPDLHHSFGESGSPAAYWRRAEEESRPVLRQMAEVLLTTPAEAHGFWIWPAFFTRPMTDWTAADRDEARRLLGETALEEAAELGEYLGYRLAIHPEGRWQYFVAGD